MEASIENFKLIHKAKDDKFDVEQLQNYNLTLQIGFRDFQLCIFDTKNMRCLLLEAYVFDNVTSPAELVNILENIWENHHLLLAGFWNTIKISFKNSKFTQVPLALFEKDAQVEYLSLNCHLDLNQEEVFYYQHLQCDTVTVFAADHQVLSWLKNTYPIAKLQIIHHTSSLLEGFLKHDDHAMGKTVHVYFQEKDLTVVATDNKRLLFINKFKIAREADFVKYVLLVLQQLALDQFTTKVIIRGHLTPQSDQFLDLHKFVKNLSFGGRPSFLKYGFVFDELPEYQYFDVYSTYLCD